MDKFLVADKYKSVRMSKYTSKQDKAKQKKGATDSSYEKYPVIVLYIYLLTHALKTTFLLYFVDS